MKKRRVEDEELPSLRDTLMDDEYFSTYRRIVKTIERTLDLDKFYQECINMHDSRPSRNLIGRVVGVADLGAALRQDVQFRGRYSKIEVTLKYQCAALEESIKVTRRHMLSKYREYVDHLTTKTDRMDYMSRYLTRGMTLANKMKSVIECIDVLVKDIDACHWQMKIAFDCIEIAVGKAAQTGM